MNPAQRLEYMESLVKEGQMSHQMMLTIHGLRLSVKSISYMRAALNNIGAIAECMPVVAGNSTEMLQAQREDLVSSVGAEEVQMSCSRIYMEEILAELKVVNSAEFTAFYLSREDVSVPRAVEEFLDLGHSSTEELRAARAVVQVN